MSSKTLRYILVMVSMVLLAILFWPKGETQVNLGARSSALSDFKEQAVERLSSQSAYSDIVQKPLFKVSRLAFKPVVVPREEITPNTEAKTVTASSPLPDLLGVMHIDGIERAFLKGKSDLEAVGLGVGDQYKDWELTAISATAVVLSNKTSDETVALDWGDADLSSDVNNPRSKRPVVKEEYIAAGAGFRQQGTQHLKDRLATQIERDPLELD